VTIRLRFAAVWIAAILFACTPAVKAPPAAAPLPPQPPRFAPAGTASRVVLLSFDGLGADELQAFGAGETFTRLAAEGTAVARVTPVTPTVTASTHTAILTGATPERSGIVANKFHLPGTPAKDIAVGLDTDIDAETIVEAARRQGKRVGTVAFPTMDASSPRRTADWGLIFRRPLTASRLVRLTRRDFHPEWVPPSWGAPPAPRHPSFSPVLRARIDWTATPRVRQDVDVVAYDTTDDRMQNYDALFVETPDGETAIDARGWFPVAKKTDEGLYGSWAKVLRRDPALDGVTIYWGVISRNDAYPESFRRMIDDEAGFWPGQPDEPSAAASLDGREGIDVDTFIEQNDRFGEFLTHVTLLAVTRMQADLVLAYQPTIDVAEHQFRITDPAQKNATESNRAAGERVRRRAMAECDRTTGEVARVLDRGRDALIVTGDHGVASVDTEVRLGRLLATWGFAPRWGAFAGGNIAQLYRFEGNDDAEDLVRRLTELQSPDGVKVFERVERKTATSHRNSGDLVAFAFPRFSLTAAEGEPFAKPSYYGQHGGIAATHHEFDTTLLAWGAGVPAVKVPRIRQTEIARYVAQLLGIAAPRDAE
jgi:predicted AlkP superfamily phosphohydrolase/phosphomutase